MLRSVVAQQGQGPSPIGILVGLLIGIVVFVGYWKMFVKAGVPGWAAIIPIYNAYKLIKIAGRPGWWLLLLLIPIVNFVIIIIVMIDLARSFGHGTGFGIGLAFLSPIFIPILGFGSSRYIGPAAATGTTASPPYVAG
ncbi:MAG: hypothetical protein NVS4B8_27080 [Herpetosiphon sp.]